ncbi:DUF202 domain-containing protein [Microcella sp.]|uniref:DUF202 domain-containing protein n=1 Tax=Microcella sp. TaxID=1913979 RepID=UPI003F701665
MNAAAPDARRAPVDRTSLSWQRTAMHSALLALVAAVTAITLGEPLVAGLAAVAAGFAILVGATTPRVKRSEVADRDPWTLMVRTVIVLSATALVAVMLVVAVALEL